MSNIKILHKWKSFFEDKGLKESLVQSYLEYIESLLLQNLPIIFETDHLSLLLGRTSSYLNSVLFSPESHYRNFKIKKRSGGYREIDVPYPALLECQYWIYKNILSKIKLNYCAHGFAKKKSIVTNAKVHLNQSELLKIDLENFFPSISKNRVIAMFCRLNYPPKVAFYLASICCFDGHLPQGAPTSPSISNILAIQLDRRIFAFSKKFNLKYSRYADDLAISGDKLPVKFIDYLTNIIHAEGFKVNTSKTQLYNKKGKRILTGVSISTDKLKIPKEYKRKLFQEIYYINKFGFHSHVIKKKIRNPYYINSIIGKLNYVLNVEPDNDKARAFRKQFIEIEKSYAHIKE
ncbi:reverse transcriptase family protein [Candidatus Omnitrophota bacterium]